MVVSSPTGRHQGTLRRVDGHHVAFYSINGAGEATSATETRAAKARATPSRPLALEQLSPICVTPSDVECQERERGKSYYSSRRWNTRPVGILG